MAEEIKEEEVCKIPTDEIRGGWKRRGDKTGTGEKESIKST